MEPDLLLHRYRLDRRKLLEFIISSGLERPPTDAPLELAGVHLDTCSVDYVLHCAQSGTAFDHLEASRAYYNELNFPITIDSSAGNYYFLLSNPDSSGSPPGRDAPKCLLREAENCSSLSMKQSPESFVMKCDATVMENEICDLAAKFKRYQPLEGPDELSLGLPDLRTGLSDDDLRETAYEVLLTRAMLSCMSSGPLQLPGEEKKEKKPRYLTRIRHKRDGASSLQSSDSCSQFMEIIRVQMEISEAMDTRTKQGLKYLCSSSSTTHENIDVTHTVLEFLKVISREDFLSEKAYAQWHKRQANVLEELLYDSTDFAQDEHTPLSIVLLQLRNREEYVLEAGPTSHAEILNVLKRHASTLSNLPQKFGVPSETYYWRRTFHFNIAVYEKLLYSVFDVLEDGQLVEELDDILDVLKLTWPILGITEKIHNALFGWVLFRQFIRTRLVELLNGVVCQMQNLSSCHSDIKEQDYMDSLICTGFHPESKSLSLIDTICYKISAWCGSQLEDYHFNFNQDTSVAFQNVVTLEILLQIYLADRYSERKGSCSMTKTDLTSKLLRTHIEKSIQSVFKRVVNLLPVESKMEQRHPLLILANEVKLIAEKEHAIFSAVLCQHYSEAAILSSQLLHELYGKELKPFLDGVSDLGDSVVPMLAASYSLERYLTHISYPSVRDTAEFHMATDLSPYPIRVVCRPLILHWVNSQHDRILEWTKRAVQIEEWRPLSSQQRQAVSIIEVFRIIEENTDQLFNLNLPLDIVHLRYLLIGIVRSLDCYVHCIISQQVNKDVLYPTPPSLTRYDESVTPFTKKKILEYIVPEEKVNSQLAYLTASRLCVKLNTLHYIRDQLDALEDTIQDSWNLIHQGKGEFYGVHSDEVFTSRDSVSELFTIFDDIRLYAIHTSDSIVDFIGPRLIFWDMRDSFLFSLYQSNVEGARLEMSLSHLDEALSSICDLLIDIHRDRVVSSICRASMDAFIWILLDGGPSRVFSEEDAVMMQEDLNILKDLFVADGEGLTPYIVENEARLAQQILDLFRLKADTIIEMLIRASEEIPSRTDFKNPGGRDAKDADTLLRVLCHKKDKDASNYLKTQYHLPKSSDYEENQEKNQTALLKKNNSIKWSETGQKSFRVMTRRLQEATSEIRQAYQ